MSNNNSTIVDSHRNMLMLSKNLSDFQIENLRQWPFVFFNGVENVSVSWNFIEEKDGEELFSPGFVTFDITTQKTNDLATSVVFLESCVKLMFWSDTKVNILINGEPWNSQTKSSNTKKTSRKKKTKRSKNSLKMDVPA
jgi:hypothetical protein